MSLPIFIASAGCPSATVTAALKTSTPSMIGNGGFIPPTDGVTPPDFYRTYECDGGWTYTQPPLVGSPPGTPTETIVGAGIGASDIGWNADGTSRAGTFDATETVTNAGNVTNGPAVNDRVLATVYGIFSSPTPGVYADSFTGVDNPNPAGPTNTVTLAVTSNTNITLIQAGWSYGGSTMGGGSVDFVLYDQDLEADAVARATLEETDVTAGPAPADIFAAGIGSLWEARYGNDVAQFSYVGGTYQLNCSNLAPGLQYHYVVVWEARAAAGDGTGDDSHYGTSWANSDAQSGDFTPSGTTCNVTGLTIPVAQGFQKRIKSITITPVGM